MVNAPFIVSPLLLTGTYVHFFVKSIVPSAILELVTAPSAILASVTAPLAILALVTAESAILAEVTAPSASFAFVTALSTIASVFMRKSILVPFSISTKLI